MPMSFAGTASMTVAKTNPWVKDYYGLSPFVATRPMTTLDLVAAKVRAAAISVLVSWGLALMVVVPMLLFSSAGRATINAASRWIVEQGPAKALVITTVGVIVLFVLTWRRMVGNLVLNLTGREWIIKSAVALDTLAFIAISVIAPSPPYAS
jgi:hypothetical protein